MKPTTLFLVLTHQWYDQTERGEKWIEYRAMTPLWKRRIWDRRERITAVRFSRGYTSRTITRSVERIDIGPCPIPGWAGDYYRIHFLPVPNMPSPTTKTTETITVAVELAITYDSTCKGAREEVIKCAVRDLPNDLFGASIQHGCYSVKRGRKYLVPNGQDAARNAF